MTRKLAIFAAVAMTVMLAACASSTAMSLRLSSASTGSSARLVIAASDRGHSESSAKGLAVSLISGSPLVRPWPQTPFVTLPFTEGPVQVPGSRYAYANAQGRLVRIDPAHGRVLNGPLIASDSVVFVVGSSVAVLTVPHESENGHGYLPQTLQLVNGKTATLGPSVSIPTREAWEPIAINPGPSANGVWLSANSASSEVELVDVRTGALLRLMRFSSSVVSLSPFPDGKFIYVVLYDHKSCPATLTLDELAETSGRVLAHTCIGGTVATLTAVTGGIWASVRTGMHGYDALYRSNGLAQVMTGLSPNATEETAYPTLNGDANNGIRVRYFGHNIWLESASGISCVAPDSGRFIAGTVFRTFNGMDGVQSLFADWNGRVYTTGQESSETEIVVVRPPNACRA